MTIGEYLENKLGKKRYGRLLDALYKQTRVENRVQK